MDANLLLADGEPRNHAPGGTHEMVATAPPLDLAAMTLVDELETDWLPDPWAWSDLDDRNTARLDVYSAPLDAPLPFRVAFVGDRLRTVPLLSTPVRIRWHQLALEVAWRGRASLSPTVRGYRAVSASKLSHYRAEYRQRVALEQELAERFPRVLSFDVERFFASTSAETVWTAVHRHLAEQKSAQLQGMLHNFDTHLGYALPEGYAASRALSNFCLTTVDDCIGHPFTRWLDDYRVFLKDEADAHSVLSRAQDALGELGLRIAQGKVRLHAVSELDQSGCASLGDLHDEVADPAAALRSLLANWPEAEVGWRERWLRHLLRLAAERRDHTAVVALREMHPTAIPPAVYPRLAWLLAVTADNRATVEFLEELLDPGDPLWEWRCARLAPALWYADAPELVASLSAYADDWPTCLALLRPVIRHAPNLLSGLAANPPSAWDADRARRLVEHERDVQASLAGPPVRTFL